MFRNDKRKPSKVTRLRDIILRAVHAIKLEGTGVSQTSRCFQIPRATLYRYCSKITAEELKKWKSNQSENLNIPFESKNSGKVFSREQEIKLVDYITKSANIYYGLSSKDMRKLAYEYGVMCKVTMPKNWTNDKSAGHDWFAAFRKRSKSKLPLRVQEATRSTHLRNVRLFWKNLRSVIERYHLTPADIWNVDKIGLTATVQKPKKVVGVDRVVEVKSVEPGSLMLAVSATENSISPLFIFSRVHCHSYFLNSAPPSSEVCVNPSGSMKNDRFYLFLKHFVNSVKCSIQRPVLLLLDYHQSHLSLRAIDYARENGVCVISFPPHWTRKIEPSDMSVYGLLKCYCDSYSDYWVKRNPGKTMTIDDVPEIIKWVLPLATTTKNILAGYQATRVCPFSSGNDF